MKCPKCGNELKDGINFCPMCGSQIVNDQPITVIEQNNNNNANEIDSSENKFVNGMGNDVAVGLQAIFLAFGLPIILSMIVSFLPSSSGSGFLAILIAISRLSAFPLIIYAHKKYTKSIFIKVLFVLAIIDMVIILFFILLFVSLLKSCEHSSLGSLIYLFNMVV